MVATRINDDGNGNGEDSNRITFFFIVGKVLPELDGTKLSAVPVGNAAVFFRVCNHTNAGLISDLQLYWNRMGSVWLGSTTLEQTLKC